MRFRAKNMPLHIGDPMVRTDGHVTFTSLLKFLGLIGYQIRLAMLQRCSADLLARGLRYDWIQHVMWCKTERTGVRLIFASELFAFSHPVLSARIIQANKDFQRSALAP